MNSKSTKIIYWIATLILLLWEAIMPLGTWIFAPEYMTFGTRAIVYPNTPKTLKEWAYAGLSFTLLFAFISHACVDKNIAYMIMPLFFLGILAVSYIYNQKLNATTLSFK